jgi:hypothetical protein
MRRIDEAVKTALDNRADKSWTPLLFASAQTAAALKVVTALRVHSDAELPEGILQIRSVEAVDAGEDHFPAGSVMAWFTVPKDDA